MRSFLMVTVFLAGPAAASGLTPGTYTNEEEVYFDKEAGKVPAPWIGVRIDADKRIVWVDAYGQAVSGKAFPLRQTDATTISVITGGGKTSRLQRARGATCWGSVPKIAKKTDGTDDWYFVPGLKLHDRGGRVKFGGGDTGAPPVVLRMRNVVWPTGTNKPSLVLYVHKPENPDHAESYSWADPDARRIGINLRWMQASCSID
jgi:hypothetical protein